MKNVVDKVRIGSILIAFSITVVAWTLCGNFTRWISDCLNDLHKPMSSWALSYPIFSLSIGHIPLTSYFIWKRNPTAKYLSLVSFWLIAWCVMILGVIAAFVLADLLVKPESPFLPEYIVWLPFLDYWNLVVPLASVLGLGAVLLVRKWTTHQTSMSQGKVIDDVQ